MAFPTGWGRVCELVIQASKVPADATDFPVYINEDCVPSEFLDADGSYPALNGGGDVRTSADSAGSTQIPLEVVDCTTDNDPANGTLELHTKRTLSSASNTSIWIWYNKSGETQPSESDTYGKHNVWDSNFKLVQHMNQDPSGSAPQMIDSTSNSNDGTSAGSMTSGDLIDGMVGKGLNFDGTNDGIDCGADSSLNITTEFTVEVAFNIPTPSRFKGMIEFNVSRCGIGIDNNLNPYVLYNSKYKIPTSSGIIAANTDTIVAGAFSGTTALLYKDGVSQSLGTQQTAMSGASKFLIGGSVAGSYFLNGNISEVRVSNTVRSANWITTEYNNQSSPSTFIIEGTPETPGGGTANPWYYYAQQ